MGRKFPMIGLAFILCQSVAVAQKPTAETLVTADGVKLKGLFHTSPGGAGQNHAVVLLLYQPGAGTTMAKPGKWDGLAEELVKAGFHVFQFDWRGHGQSTALANPATFWGNNLTGPWNTKFIRGSNAKPAKNTIDAKDFDPKYFPAYVQDLAAVRQHLDAKNDQNAVNTSALYVIGANDTASIGMLWLAAEWSRPAVAPNANQLGGAPRYEAVPQQLFGGIGVEAGNDIAGCIWLSASKPAAIRERDLMAWPKNSQKLRTSPALYLYGNKDDKGETDGKFYFNQVLVAGGNKMLGVAPANEIRLVDVKGTKLNGVNLLGNDVGTEGTILQYLAAMQKNRGNLVRKPRNYSDPYYISLSAFGLMP